MLLEFYLALQALGALIIIATIGDERKPYTRAQAIFHIILSAFYSWGLIVLANGG